MEKSNINFFIFLSILLIFRYDGNWEDGKKHGKGVYTYSSGNK